MGVQRNQGEPLWTPAEVRPVVGIDVSAAWVDGATAPAGPRRQFAQTAAGHQACLQWLAALGGGQPLRVGLEATGTYSEPLARALLAAGHTVLLCNPLQVHRYRQALARRTKTDALDAEIIAQFCARHPELPAWTPPSPTLQRLRTLVRTRRLLVAQRQQLRNQQHAAQGTPEAEAVASLLAPVQAALDGQLAVLERELQTLGEPATPTGSALRTLRSIPGVGLVTAATVLAYVPLERFARAAEAVAYVGLCPREQRSGSSVRGQRGIGGAGPAGVRCALYVPALVAIRHNPDLRVFAARLRARGKPPKVVLGAVMRKLVVLAWTLLHTGQTWHAQLAPAPA